MLSEALELWRGHRSNLALFTLKIPIGSFLLCRNCNPVLCVCVCVCVCVNVEMRGSGQTFFQIL